MAYKSFRVGDTYIDLSPEEVAVTQTRLFQRLNFIKQLGLAYLVYPNATHTRGSHSLKVLSQAQRIMDALQKSEESPTVKNSIKEAASAVRMAALLHDIGHAPFGHTLEDEHLVLAKHDGVERINATLELLKSEIPGNHPPKVFSVIDSAVPILHALANKSDQSLRTWKSDIVGNTICADLLAYIEDDAKWSGIEPHSGHYSIYNYFALAGKNNDQLCVRLTKGGLRTDVVSAIIGLLEARYALTERVLFHHGKCVASAMLARAVKLCGFVDVAPVIERHMGDESFLDYLEGIARDNSQDALRLLDQLRSRRLHKRIFKVARGARQQWDNDNQPKRFSDEWRDIDNVEALLVKIENRFNLPQGSLVLWCANENAGRKLAEVQVIWDVGSGLQGPTQLRSDVLEDKFPTVVRRVKNQEEQYKDLWAFWVAIDAEHLPMAAEVVHALEETLQIQCDALFRDTYLRQRVLGYQEAEDITKEVDLYTEALLDEVRHRLANAAAYDGKVQINQQVVFATMQEVMEGTAMFNSQQKQLELPAPQPTVTHDDSV